MKDVAVGNRKALRDVFKAIDKALGDKFKDDPPKVYPKPPLSQKEKKKRRKKKK